MAQTLTHGTNRAVSLQAHGPGFSWTLSGIGYTGDGDRLEQGVWRMGLLTWEVREPREMGKSRYELDCAEVL